MPRGFAVVGFNCGFFADGEFGIVAIGELGVESVGAGFLVGGIGERAFDGESLDFGDTFCTAGDFEILVDDFVGVLRARDVSACEQEHGEKRNEETGAHAVLSMNANSEEKFHEIWK